MAEGLLSTGRPGLALSMVQPVLDARPGDGRARTVQARALAGLGQCREALALFAETRGGPGWGARSLLDEARCHHHLGDDAGERVALEEAVALDPGSVEAWVALARLGDATGDERLSAHARERALEEGGEPWQIDLADARREVLAGSEWADAAMVAIVPLRALTNEVAVLEGIRWLDLGWPEAAAQVLYEAVRGDLRDPEAAAWRAEALRRVGDLEQAAAALERPWIAQQDPTPLLAEVRARVARDAR